MSAWNKAWIESFIDSVLPGPEFNISIIVHFGYGLNFEC